VEKVGVEYFMQMRRMENRRASAMFGKVFKHVEETYDWKKHSFEQRFCTIYPFIIKQRIKLALTMNQASVGTYLNDRALVLVRGWLKFRKDLRQCFLTVKNFIDRVIII